jgi:hypothetical protein
MKLSNRFTLLALGVIVLSALAASPSSAQNASTCRSSVGVIGDFVQRCLTRPDGTLGALIKNSVDAVGTAHDDAELGIDGAAHTANSTRPGGDNDPNLATRGRGSVETTGGTYSPGAAAAAARVTKSKGGNGGATGKTGPARRPRRERSSRRPRHTRPPRRRPRPGKPSPQTITATRQVRLRSPTARRLRLQWEARAL